MNSRDEIREKLLEMLNRMSDEDKEETFHRMRMEHMTDFVAIVMAAADTLAEVIAIDNMDISTDEKIRKMIDRKSANG